MDLLYFQFFLYLIAASRIVRTIAVYNSLDSHFRFVCDNTKQAIFAIDSQHYNREEDRQFTFRCRDVPSNTDRLQAICRWSGFINDYDDPMNYQCPGNHYVSGMASQHSNRKEDRIWSFNCCSIPGY